MSQLELLKDLLGSPTVSDAVLQFYLDNARDIICDIRDSNIVEEKYYNTQIKIAIQLFNKRGAEGQIGHSENGIDRTYKSADISDDLINEITPFCKAPFAGTRIVV